MARAAAAARPLRRLAGCLAASVLLSLEACSGAGTDAHPEPTVTPTRSPVTAVVDQFRDGYASGTIVLQLMDTTQAPVAVVRAELVDARFAAGTVWNGSTDLQPGLAVSLPALASAPACGSPHDGAPSVRVRLPDGSEIVVPADDPHGVLSRIHAERCFAERVAALADLRFDGGLSPGAAPGTAVLSLVVGSPQGGPAAGSPPASRGSGSAAGTPQLTLASVGGTTLLDQDPSAPWPRGLALYPGETVPLTVRAARCDPHVVAEDKVGTLIPLTLEAAGETGVLKVAASTDLRAEIYSFVAGACGWSGG